MQSMDTLHAYETLRSKGGFADPAAKAMVEAMTSLVTPSFADLATKADLDNLRLATKADIEQLRLATKAGLAEVKADLLHRLQMTAFGLVGANLTAIAIATGILLRVLGK